MEILDKVKERRIYTYENFTDPQEEIEKVSEVTDLPEVKLGQRQQAHKKSVTRKNREKSANDDIKMNNKEENLQTINVNEISKKASAEVETMVTYILNKGKEIPLEVCNLLSSEYIEDIINVHGSLSKIIHPSSPETISYVRNYENSKKRLHLFSHIPLVRNFIIIAILVILSLIVSGLSPEVNVETLSKGILNNSGISLLQNLIFLCSAAGIGTVFFLLSKLTKEVKEATLSQDDITYYWAMLVMGMLSGLILSEIIVLNYNGLEEESIEMNRLLFALVGGFSSEVVYSILQRIMGKVQRLISE